MLSPVLIGPVEGSKSQGAPYKDRRLELLLAFEDAFGIEIPDTDAGLMRCVHDAVAYIEAHVAAGGAHVSLDAPSKDGWPGTGSVHH